MDMYEKIWHEFIDKRYGDEYLCRYVARQIEIRKWFKIVTILLSATGIWTAIKSFTIPTIISLSVIAIVQLATLVENFVIHSEKQIEDLGNLRLLYYEQWNRLEKFFITYGNYSEKEAADKFFELRDVAKNMEDLDNKLNIKKIKRLASKAELSNRDYLKTHYNV
jgi:hypothetical protein